MGTLWKIVSSWLLWFGLFLIIVLGIAFHLVLGKGAKVSVTQQLLNQQQIIARAEASNIITFFEKFGNSVAVLARLSSIESRNANATSDMDAFVEQQRGNGIVVGVVLTDKYGIVQFNSNILGTRDLGKSLADRDFFIWARDEAKEGEYFISKPIVGRLEASEGQAILVVASPVYQYGEFSGVVASQVRLHPLTERFFELMKISDQTEVYVIDEQGNVLHSNTVPDEVGLNISELFSGDQTLRDGIENALSSTGEGKFQTDKRLIAYTPIILGTQSWLLVIFTPAEEVEDLTTPFYVRQTAMLIVTAFTILLFGVIVIRKRGVN